VEEVFSKPENQAFADEYAKELRENHRDVAHNASRSITLAVVLAGAFELLSRASIDKVSLGPFEVSDFTLIS